MAEKNPPSHKVQQLDNRNPTRTVVREAPEFDAFETLARTPAAALAYDVDEQGEAEANSS